VAQHSRGLDLHSSASSAVFFWESSEHEKGRGPVCGDPRPLGGLPGLNTQTGRLISGHFPTAPPGRRASANCCVPRRCLIKSAPDSVGSPMVEIRPDAFHTFARVSLLSAMPQASRNGSSRPAVSDAMRSEHLLRSVVTRIPPVTDAERCLQTRTGYRKSATYF